MERSTGKSRRGKSGGSGLGKAFVKGRPLSPLEKRGEGTSRNYEEGSGSFYNG